MKCKIENNETSYPLISVINSILVNFMNLATDIGSFIDAGRLFHNIDPLNFNIFSHFDKIHECDGQTYTEC